MNIRHVILALALLVRAAAGQDNLVRLEQVTEDVPGLGVITYENFNAAYHGAPVLVHVLDGELFGLAGKVALVQSSNARVGPVPLSVLDKLDNSAAAKVITTVCLYVINSMDYENVLLGAEGTLSEAVIEVEMLLAMYAGVAHPGLCN